MDYTEKRKLILKGDMAKVILTLSVPLMINNLIQTIYNLTDTFFVSRLGDIEVNAVGFVWPIIFFMMSIAVGLSIAGTALISQYTGANDNEQAKVVAGQIISFSFISSTVLGILGFFATPFIVSIMGAEGELFNYSVDFLRIILLGLPTMFIFFAFKAIKQGQGDTYTPMVLVGFSVALNIILDPIFIFVFNLGVSGAAIATVLARGILAIYAMYILFTKDDGIRLNKSHLKIKKYWLKKIILVGLPSSIGQSTASLGFAVLNVFVKSFGSATLTAFIIGNRINSLILMPAMGIGSALATIVGQNLGKDNILRARKAVKTSAALATIFLIIGGTIVFITAPQIINLFTNSEDVILQATFYLRVISASLPLMGIFQVFNGTFQGSGHTIMAMLIMGSRLWVFRIPLILIFKNFTTLGEKSVWFAMILSNASVCLIGFILYLSRKWENKIIKQEFS